MHPPRTSQFLSFTRPWVVEVVVFFLVLWQEDIRLQLRTAAVQLPVPQAFQALYYYRFGDFANGYVNAFLVDGVVDLGLSYWRASGSRSLETSGLLGLRSRAGFAALLSALSIVLYEVCVPGLAPVSYTHLRAHETVLDLVCRLLLEKKNKHPLTLYNHANTAGSQQSHDTNAHNQTT